MPKRKRPKSTIQTTLEQMSRHSSPRAQTFIDRKKEANRLACRSQQKEQA